MYGYIHGINTSRKLEAEADRNIEVIWLLSGLKPSYKTIAATAGIIPTRSSGSTSRLSGS